MPLVNKKKLLEHLEENKKKHIVEYKQALTDYKDVAKQRLIEAYEAVTVQNEENFTKIQHKIDKLEPANSKGIYEILVETMIVRLEAPQNYEKEYNSAIEVITWDSRDEIPLNMKEFKSYVQDDWEWTDNFKNISSTYRAAKLNA